ncbi:RDD family protein [Nocardia camponoti]|nr:RDD family protein [Nocardia camponoti]
MTRTSFRRLIASRKRWEIMTIEHHRDRIQEWVRLFRADGTVAGELILRRWMRRTFTDDDTVVWFAGRPDKCGLIAMPGGRRTVLAYRSLWYTPPPFGRARVNPDGSYRKEGFTFIEQPDRERWVKPAPPTPEPKPEPVLYGGLDDTRFPSSRRLRRSLAFAVDILLHGGIAFAIAYVVGEASFPPHDFTHLHINALAVVGLFLAVSFFDRVIIQAATHTTMGKAIFGLVIIDRDTGVYPRARWLLAAWLVSTFLGAMTAMCLAILIFAQDLGDIDGPRRPERYLLPSVRRKDMHQPRATEDISVESAPSAREPVNQSYASVIEPHQHQGS